MCITESFFFQKKLSNIVNQLYFNKTLKNRKKKKKDQTAARFFIRGGLTS